MFLIGFRLSFITILICKVSINYLDLKNAMKYFNLLMDYFYMHVFLFNAVNILNQDPIRLSTSLLSNAVKKSKYVI